MKIGTLSPIPLGISWLLSIFILGLTINKLELLNVLNDNYVYPTILFLYLIILKGLQYIYSGRIKISLTSDENFKITIEKLPLFSKLRDQNIKLQQIDHFRVSNGRACDRIIIVLKGKESIKICTNNLKNFFSFRDEKSSLISFFLENNIKQEKSSWKDGI
jgi:hypothetical protein